MKKKLIFCICILLCVIMCVSSIPFSAITYDCEVDVTSKAVLVANLETGTFVYEKKSNMARFWSYLSNIMTFIIVRDEIDDIDKKVKIKEDFLDSLEESDGTLEKYAGKSLTVKDLLAFAMLTDGSDACHVLADYVTKGKPEEFVKKMNKKAKELGCKKTKFSSPACVKDDSQYTTCVDAFKIIKCALKTPAYKKIASKPYYVLDGYKGDQHTIGNTNSLLKQSSPYYFKHVKNGKYGQDDVAKGNIVAVSEYADVSYVCIVLGADITNEHNAFTETKQLLTWAYTTLGNEMIIPDSSVITTITAKTEWGESTIELIPGEDVVSTVPADYSPDSFTFKYKSSKKVSLPIFEGQNMGTAKMYFEEKYLDDIDLVSNSSEGISMLSDLGSFAKTMFDATVVEMPSDDKDNEDKDKSKEKTSTKKTKSKSSKSSKSSSKKSSKSSSKSSQAGQ